MPQMPLEYAEQLQTALKEVKRTQSGVIGDWGRKSLDRHIANLETLIHFGRNSPNLEDDKRFIALQPTAAYPLYHELEMIQKRLIAEGKEPPDRLTDFMENTDFKNLEKPDSWRGEDFFDTEEIDKMDTASLETSLKSRQSPSGSSDEDLDDLDWGDDEGDKVRSPAVRSPDVSSSDDELDWGDEDGEEDIPRAGLR